MAEGEITRQDFKDKVKWEGGLLDALEYGLDCVIVDDDELNKLWLSAQRAFIDLENYTYRIEKIIGE